MQHPMGAGKPFMGRNTLLIERNQGSGSAASRVVQGGCCHCNYQVRQPEAQITFSILPSRGKWLRNFLPLFLEFIRRIDVLRAIVWNNN